MEKSARDYYIITSFNSNIDTIINIFHQITINRKFLSTWMKLPHSELIDLKVREYVKVSDPLLNKITANINGLSEIAEFFFNLENKGKEILNNIDNINKKVQEELKINNEIVKESLKIDDLFDEIWQLFEEEVELPVLTKIPVMTRLIDSKRYNEWRNTG